MIVDPLIMPVGAINLAGRTALDLIGRLRHELKVNTTCGASNISFGLPNRHGMNAAFLSMAAGAGMTSAIMNPLHAEEITAIMGANVMNGIDQNAATGYQNSVRHLQKELVDVNGGNTQAFTGLMSCCSRKTGTVNDLGLSC